MDYVKLGENIRMYRRQRNLTQEQLSEMSCISAVFMSQIENARGKPSLETVVSIAKSLNVSIDILIYDTTSPKELTNFIDVDLTHEQLNIISYSFKKRSAKEISALLKAFTFLLDFDKG